ncbi:MAG: phosphopyruvate hydratase [Methanocorpusculum sp.]|uniref:phosphopyruvate hydratase n=1 Tax=Methanocorpusculum sp. TaxID=2058474 RepID=UPI0027169655|nr:phosphopyruvate hydratase [Methanocorpusculum sp.]MDO9522251.1 phosphopyruvate hydratase [Methanocorpusculum sp.]
MTEIAEIFLRTILDSRGNPTVEAEISTISGGFGRACAPSGASTGIYEAKVRPCDEAVFEAREHLIPKLIELDSADQRGFDETLHEIDGTSDLSGIGANIAVALSLANAKAAASSLNMELYQYLGGAFVSQTPLPLGNVIGGGAHAVDATDIQEFLIIPTGASSAAEAVFTNALVHKRIKEILIARGKGCGKGDEGAWAPHITDLEAFEIVNEATTKVFDETNIEVRMGLDVAASEMWDAASGRYVYKNAKLTTEEQIAYIADLTEKYDLLYVEDPIQEEDFEGFARITEEVSGRDTLICGDDLFVTNVLRLEEGIRNDACNCVLIKPNQIGTLSDTFETISLARDYGYETVMSHRSGETTDNTIAHLATAFGCCFMKSGVVGGERIAKLNELIRIEEHF